MTTEPWPPDARPATGEAQDVYASLAVICGAGASA